VGLTSLVVTLMVFVAFKSLVVPLRCLVTIACTLAFVYGSANRVVQQGGLEWTRVHGVRCSLRLARIGTDRGEGGSLLHQVRRFVCGASPLTPGLEGREIHWCSPIMLFGVLVGLALDYDVFLLTRIVEYRNLGFSDSDAVRAGLASSFPVITAAGGFAWVL
jgi:hypothetical protein